MGKKYVNLPIWVNGYLAHWDKKRRVFQFYDEERDMVVQIDEIRAKTTEY